MELQCLLFPLLHGLVQVVREVVVAEIYSYIFVLVSPGFMLYELNVLVHILQTP